MKIATSGILSAFQENAIGSKVTNREDFIQVLEGAIQKHDQANDKVPGQHFVNLPACANNLVTTGMGMRTSDPEDYVLREHRGRVEAYLRRENAASTESVSVIVYTREAYLNDPDVIKMPEEIKRIKNLDCTHVVVAVLASGGPKGRSPLTPYRLVHNLAGGNNEAKTWALDEIFQKSQEAKSYWDQWAVVAD